MSTLVNINDPRLARLYKEAERRNLDYELSVDEFGVMYVDSYSRPGLKHKVTHVDESHVRCECETTDGKACSHASLAISFWHPAIWTKWFTDECAQFLKLRHKIRTGAELSQSEKRRVNAAMRERKSLAERMDNSVPVVGSGRKAERVNGIRV